jgi:hypothetical protein
MLTVPVACFLHAPALAADPIPAKQFDEIRQLIRPQNGESKYVDEVPWMPSLWEARKKAAAEGKPLVILATGYHPLGIC